MAMNFPEANQLDSNKSTGCTNGPVKYNQGRLFDLPDKLNMVLTSYAGVPSGTPAPRTLAVLVLEHRTSELQLSHARCQAGSSCSFSYKPVHRRPASWSRLVPASSRNYIHKQLCHPTR